MKPRSELVDRGVIDPTKEIFGIDIIVYKDLPEAGEYLTKISGEFPCRSLFFYPKSKVLNYIIK